MKTPGAVIQITCCSISLRTQTYRSMSTETRRFLILSIKHTKDAVLKKGFTLIELLITIVFLGILTLITLPNYLNKADRAREVAAELAVISAAKGCAAMLVSGSNTQISEYNNSIGLNVIASSECSEGVSYTSAGFGADGGNLSTQAVAVVDGLSTGLTQYASSN